jgi:tetratricopeptide (TPR) repeat protein
MAGELSSERRKLFDLYAAGLSHYRLGQWAEALDALQGALDHDPDDGPSQTLFERAEQFRSAPPPEWDGVWRMTSK